MIKTLLKCVRQYKKPAILTPIFITIEVIMESFMVFITKDLVNLMNEGDTSKVWYYAIALVIMAFISLACGIANGITGAIASSGFAANLRHDLFHKIQDFSFENIDSFQTSSLVTRLTTDVTNIQMAFQMILRIAIRCPLMIIFSVVMSFIINWELALLFVIILPFLAFALFQIIRVTMPTYKRLFKKYDKLNNSIQENIKGIRVVKSYVREDFEINKFDSASNELCNDFTKAEKILALNGPIMQFCIQVSILLVSYFSAKTICEHSYILSNRFNDMEVGEYSSLITFGVQMLSGMMMLSFIFVMITISLECCHRACEVLNTTSNLHNPENPIYEVKSGDIEFKDVNFKYKKESEKYALSDVNLKIKSGQTVGIIGGTGSSKTTLVNLISRLYDTTTGDIYVGGVNVKDYDIESLRNSVSVVLQKNVLFSGTLLENLRWGNSDATLDEVRHACKLSQADEFVMAMPNGYNSIVEQGGTNFSGGQKQRLCIARALLKKPKVIILDDSTSAVDTKTDALIKKSFKEYIPDTTKIIIAQRISSIQDSDLIVVMDNGKIDQVGTHDELLKTNAIYQEVYYSQNKVGDTNE